MKKLFLLPVLLFSVLLFTGCSDDDDDENGGGEEIEDIIHELKLPDYAANTDYLGDLENPSETIEEDWGTYYKTIVKDKSNIFSLTCISNAETGYGWGYMFTNKTSGKYTSITKKGINNDTYVVVGMTSFYEYPFIFLDGVSSDKTKKYTLDGMYVTNSYYAYDSMKNGDNIAKKFEIGDWFKLTIYNADKSQKVETYLANFQNGNNKILDKWEWIDLSTLGETNGLQFELSSSDNGEYGMNTPAYFCLDGIKLIEKAK